MIKTYNPTSPGIRSRKTLVKQVSTDGPHKPLLEPLNGAAGRNHGRISSRHRERGTKKFYRIIDFKRDKVDIEATVSTIEHDPNRGPNIALVFYADGAKTYILAPEGLKVGDKIKSGRNLEPVVGNSMPLEDIPLAVAIHNIEINPGRGGQLARGAGNSCTILAKEDKHANVKLPSGEVKKILLVCKATIGVLSNSELRNTRLGKAGLNRHMGSRPHVRGVAMSNPTDHPHAGSYRDNGTGNPKSPWGWPTRGVKTRNRKHTNKYIVTPRKNKRK